VRSTLPKAFESEDYAAKREATVKTIEEEREELLAELNKRAQEEGFILQSSPIGLLTIPVIRGKPVSEQEFLLLNPKVREEIQRKREELNTDLRNAMRQLKGLEGKANEELKKLNHDVALFAIGDLVSDLKEKYKEFSETVAYTEEVQNDILENFEHFIKGPEAPPTPFQTPWMENVPFRKYDVNVAVDNSGLKGAPVILELNPTYQNLLGRIEKEAQFGVLTTDLTMIRVGSLHKANGGYLVLPAEEMLKNALVWDGLKTALRSQQATVEEPGERLGFITVKDLKPEPMPLNVKVILIGNPFLYQTLYEYDMDFKEMFKVKADFDIAMNRTEENMRKYAAFICTFCQKEDMKHLDASAVAKTIEYGSRLADDQEKHACMQKTKSQRKK